MPDELVEGLSELSVYLSVELAGSCDDGCRDCCARLIDVHQRAAQTELTEVAIRSLDARRVDGAVVLGR